MDGLKESTHPGYVLGLIEVFESIKEKLKTGFLTKHEVIESFNYLNNTIKNIFNNFAM